MRPDPGRRTLRLLLLALAVNALLAVGVVIAVAARGGEDPPAAEGAARLRADAFDARRAFADLRSQVELGPRPAGSAASRRLAERLRRALPRGRFEAVGRTGLRNVVGHLPGRGPAVVVAAHYDTKDLPGFVGANDGASGTASVVELARALRRAPAPAGAREVRFVLFDGEEAPGEGDFYTTGLRGSKAYAARHGGDVGEVVLLDFVGDRRLRIPRERSSDEALWARLRAAARRVGAQAAFPDAEQGEVLDDHTPFLRRGIPAIDLIDFDFPCFHRTCDDMSAVSASSLDRVGETVFALVQELRRPRG